MAISASLIAKGIAGTLALSAPVATSVYYKDNIYELFVSKTKDTTTLPAQTQNEEEGLQIKNDTEGKINLTYKDNGKCSITVNDSYNLSKVKTELEKLLGSSDLTENNKRHRRGLIKKCKDSNGNNISISVSDANNIDLSTLFDLSTAELNEEEKKLASSQWSLTSSVDSNKLTVTISISLNNESEINSSKVSVNTCKIIGEKGEGEETINETHLTNSKDDIKTSVETEINKNKENFLKKCKKNFNNEIKLTLKKKTDESNNKYELENLTSIFTAS